jgi:hypothetical protein
VGGSGLLQSGTQSPGDGDGMMISFSLVFIYFIYLFI